MAWSMLPKLGARPKGSRPAPGRGRRRLLPRRSLDYEQIKAEVLEAIGRLPEEQARKIPPLGTLPELMVGLALALLRLPFEAQINEQGGRVRIGGSVVDYKVWLGAQVVIVRVQGDYWHSIPDRKVRDEMQFARLHWLGYLVADIWEHDLYLSWVHGSFLGLVRGKILGAR